jgi:hypothetical protein
VRRTQRVDQPQGQRTARRNRRDTVGDDVDLEFQLVDDDGPAQQARAAAEMSWQ